MFKLSQIINDLEKIQTLCKNLSRIDSQERDSNEIARATAYSHIVLELLPIIGRLKTVNGEKILYRVLFGLGGFLLGCILTIKLYGNTF